MIIVRTNIHTIDIGTPPTDARRRSALAPIARRIVGWPFVGMAVVVIARATRTGGRGMPAPINTSASGESAATTPPVESPSTTGHVCPMHPDRIHSAPGVCPRCGVGLAPLIASAQDTRRE